MSITVGGTPRLEDLPFEEACDRALEFADPMALRGVLYQLTGDESLRSMPLGAVPGMFIGDIAAVTDPEQVAILRAKTRAVIQAHRRGTLQPPLPTREHLRSAIAMAVGQEIPEDEISFWIEEAALRPWARGLVWDGGEPPTEVREAFRVLLIGAGLAGTNAAIQLKRAGIPFIWVEKNAGAGGTWWQNTYPGATVDVPSRAYSHTWAVDYPFEHFFASQAENEGYINWAIDNFGVRSDLRTSTEITSLTWDEAGCRWVAEARLVDGAVDTIEANAVIAGVGFLDRPFIPDIEGLDQFQGPAFHTARWDHDLDLTGKRIAVIGTGASACQVVPVIASEVEHITIFQRQPPWIMPMAGYHDLVPDELAWLDKHVPNYPNWARLRVAWQVAARNFTPILYRDPEWEDEVSISAGSHAALELLTAHITEKLSDRPDLLEKCLPKYPPLAKRWVVDNGWYETLKQPNVEVVTDGISRVSARGVVTSDGIEHAADVIVFGTGFHANDYLWPMRVVGRGGLTIEERWSVDGARAYYGLMVPSFPNFFMLYGPNTNAFANGPVVWGEMQTRYALEWCKEMISGNIAMADVTEDAYNEFNKRLDERLSTSVFLDPRQKSYYTNDFGRVATNGPWSSEEYWRFTRYANFPDFEIVRAKAEV